MHGALQALGKVRAEGPVVEPDGVAIMQQARARNDGSGCSQTHRIDRAEGLFRGSHRIGQTPRPPLIAALGAQASGAPKASSLPHPAPSPQASSLQDRALDASSALRLLQQLAQLTLPLEQPRTGTGAQIGV